VLRDHRDRLALRGVWVRQDRLALPDRLVLRVSLARLGLPGLQGHRVRGRLGLRARLGLQGHRVASGPQAPPGLLVRREPLDLLVRQVLRDLRVLLAHRVPLGQRGLQGLLVVMRIH
jgi:hypothetical protein